MRVRGHASQWVLSVAAAMIAASAYAQGVAPNELSDVEKAAVGAILDSLGTKTGDELKSDVVHEIDTVKAAGKSGEAVVIAVKFGAGLKLGAFQGVLVDLCVHGGLKGYCRLASLQAPAPENDEIRTAATGADAGGAGGGGGGGGLGGGPQTSLGHNPGSSGSPSPTIFGQDLTFNFQSNFAPGTYVNYVTPNTVLTGNLLAKSPVAVPGPVAGEGLPAVGILLWLLRSWRLSRRGKAARREG